MGFTVSLAPRLRERIWQTIQDYNEGWNEVTETNWSHSTNHLEKAEQKLKRLLGKSALSAKTVDGLKEGIVAYFREGYPSNVLEVVEQFYGELGEGERGSFEKRINESMLAFGCRWLLSNGAFFCVDSEFFAELLEGIRDQFRLDCASARMTRRSPRFLLWFARSPQGHTHPRTETESNRTGGTFTGL